VVLEADPAALAATCAGGDEATLALSQLSSSGVRVADFSLGQPTLDEVFLALTGHPADAPDDGSTSLQEEHAV
jgi:ABC-2 type transport system ATP-binding protein